jgi:hypothetical protein
MQNPLTKNWTFPNLKGSAEATDVYLDVQGDLGTPSRRVSESVISILMRTFEEDHIHLLCADMLHLNNLCRNDESAALYSYLKR